MRFHFPKPIRNDILKIPKLFLEKNFWTFTRYLKSKFLFFDLSPSFSKNVIANLKKIPKIGYIRFGQTVTWGFGLFFIWKKNFFLQFAMT